MIIETFFLELERLKVWPGDISYTNIQVHIHILFAELGGIMLLLHKLHLIG